MPKALTRIDFDRLPKAPGDGHTPLLRPGCHPEASVVLGFYADGIVELRCSKCAGITGHLAVAATLEPVILLGGTDGR